MIIDRVTITGADSAIETRALRELSQRYPFVEWGILIGSHQGVPRFPWHTWIETLVDEKKYLPAMQLALHVCGAPLRKVLSGTPKYLHQLLLFPFFDRFQLNTHGERWTGHGDRVGARAVKQSLFPFGHKNTHWAIVQMDGVNDYLLPDLRRLCCQAVGLFDRSHGAGVTPVRWPTPTPNLYCGYAGGLSPENLEEEIGRLAEAAGEHRIWIDMETGVRDAQNRFDLKRVEQVLEIMEKLVDERIEPCQHQK